MTREITLVRCCGCGVPLGQSPLTPAMIDHVVHCEAHPLAQRLAEAEALRDEARAERDEMPAYLLSLRNVEPGDECGGCGGWGVRAYGSTATWHRGGIGGRAITSDVCDKCWGSGSASRPWPSHRWLIEAAKRPTAHQLADMEDQRDAAEARALAAEAEVRKLRERFAVGKENSHE